MLNQICVQGRFVKEPELKTTQSGKCFVNFCLASERSYQKSKDEKQADFIDCFAWDKTAEFISKYFSKGQMAVVAGSLQTRNWEDQQGNKRKSTEINVRDVNFADSKKETAGKEKAPSGTADDPEWLPVDDDDLPF